MSGWSSCATTAALHFSIDRDPMPLVRRIFSPPTLRSAKIGQIFEWRTDKSRWRSAAGWRDREASRSSSTMATSEPAIGDTLQAVSGHAFRRSPAAPGSADLTAHVDFQALAQAAEGMGARVHGPVTQANFLRRIGIDERAAVAQGSCAAGLCRQPSMRRWIGSPTRSAPAWAG